MTEGRKYDLEDRTERFSLRVRDFCREVKPDIINKVYVVQLIRSSGSVAANYLEANDKLGEKDLRFKIKISKKEAKECRLWLKLILTYDVQELDVERLLLLQEAEELMKIFAAILRKLGD